MTADTLSHPAAIESHAPCRRSGPHGPSPASPRSWPLPPRSWPLLPQPCPSPPRPNPLSPRTDPAPPPPRVCMSQPRRLRCRLRQPTDRFRFGRLRPDLDARVVAQVGSDLHQGGPVLAHVRTRFHCFRTRRRRFRPRNGQVDTIVSMPGAKLAASDAECTCSGADLVTNAAEQPSNAAEQVFDSLRDPAPRAVTTAVRIAVKRFQQMPQAEREAQRGSQRNDHDRSQLPRGFAAGSTRQRTAQRGPDASHTPQTKPQRASHDRVCIGTGSSGCRARLSPIGGSSAALPGDVR